MKLAGAGERTKGREPSRPPTCTWPLFSEPWGCLTQRPELNFSVGIELQRLEGEPSVKGTRWEAAEIT